MPSPRENRDFSDRPHDASTLNEAAAFFATQQLRAASLRFYVTREFQRHALSPPNASSTPEQLPARLRLDLQFLYKTPEDIGGSVFETLLLTVQMDDPEQRRALDALLRFPSPYVGHDLALDLGWLFYYQLPLPHTLWDIRVAQRALELGAINATARSAACRDQSRQIQSKKDLQQAIEDRLDLGAIAGIYRERIALRPIVTSMLAISERQREAARKNGALGHLVAVEMPWVAVNARLRFDGVRIDIARHQALLRCALDKAQKFSADLVRQGLSNPNSHDDLQQFLGKLGLLEHFPDGAGGYSFRDELLEAYQGTSPAIDLVRAYRKALSIATTQQAVSQALNPGGLVHAQHIQMGTETGRQTCKAPNLHGFDRIQKNLVIPSPGYAIGEVDYSQKEVGVAAGLSNDAELIRMYNQGDVYTQIAQRFYAGRPEVAAGAEHWEIKRFREQYPRLRQQMKVVTLASIYGQEAFGLARTLGIDQALAKEFLAIFFGLFPALHHMMTVGVTQSVRRGYVELAGGLRIYLDQDPSILPSARMRIAKNYPVQGSAAVIFKSAGVRLAQAMGKYEARLLIPMHDAFVFEAPRDCFAEVTNLTAEIMVDEFRKYFPALTPQVNMNCSRPDRWIKERGYEQALEEYLGRGEVRVSHA